MSFLGVSLGGWVTDYSVYPAAYGLGKNGQGRLSLEHHVRVVAFPGEVFHGCAAGEFFEIAHQVRLVEEPFRPGDRRPPFPLRHVEVLQNALESENSL